MKNCFFTKSSLLLGFSVLSLGVASASLVPCVISGTTVDNPVTSSNATGRSRPHRRSFRLILASVQVPPVPFRLMIVQLTCLPALRTWPIDHAMVCQPNVDLPHLQPSHYKPGIPRLKKPAARQ